MADDVSTDDRRRIVGAGIRNGRDAVVAELAALAELGVKNTTSDVIATRGSRLALRRFCTWGRGQRPDEFHTEVLDVIEINADERVSARVAFDLEDSDAAFKELEARYLAGEAAAHARTWSVIMRTYAAINRHELPATTPDWVNIDHRRGIAFAPGDATAYLRASQDPQGGVYVETVHRLSDRGAVFTWAGHGTSQEGFEAEWRGINVLTVEGDLINRGEIFDEADIDAALARFEELHRSTPRLQNAASRADERFWMSFTAREWAAMAELAADNISTDDRRRLVNAGIRQGRDDYMADMRAIAEVLPDEDMTSTAMATRGARLALTRIRGSHRAQGPAKSKSAPRCCLLLKSTPTVGWCRASGSTSTTSTPLSPNSMPDTSPAKRPPTRTRGRSTQGSTPHSTGTNFPQQPQIGSTSTIGRS